MSVDAAAVEHFGPYLVYERLGVGGMATVHRAIEHAPDGSARTVALKRLLPHLAEDASFIKAFVREAKLASLLDHVNIVHIHELGRVATQYFISMEYIDGRDVRRILRHARKVTGPPPLHVTVGLMLQLCDALDYAHGKVDADGQPLGLVHRDISPSNLLVTRGGYLKVIDFGIAKAQSSQLRTQTGRVKGKLAYMAPEAISSSRDLDARSDVWATGVILHELCTARPLFASKNEYQTLLKVQRGDILPPSTFNQACPPELDAIVFRALARAPDDRFASAAELRDELLAVAQRYQLAIGYRDVASWIEWAFGLEPSGGYTKDTGVTALSRIHAKTPRPPRDAELDEAVEVVWGSGYGESEDGPIVLEEVPDVSEKHRARREIEDDGLLADDIPTPLPSHGTMPTIYGTAAREPEIEVIPQRPSPHSLHAAEAALARGTDPPARSSRRTTGQQPGAPRTAPGGQPVARTQTGVAPIARPAATKPPRSKLPTSPGVGPTRISDRMPASAPIHVDTPLVSERVAAQRARDSAPPDNVAAPSTGFERPETLADARTNPLARPLPPAASAEELFGTEAAEVLANLNDEMDAMATHEAMPRQLDDLLTSPEIEPVETPPSVPIVRFSRSHTVPPSVTAEPTGGLDPSRSVQTKPGVAPAAAATTPRPGSASQPPRGVSRLPIAPPAPSSSRKTWLFVLAGVLVAGGTATMVGLGLGSGGDVVSATHEASGGEPAVTGATGRVKFMLEPPDASITIEGTRVHAGSPWQTELAPGNYQIEIQREGYKSWLTSLELSANETASLRVVLEPLGTITGDATLTVTTTPPGLDVLIDGTLLPDKSPIETTLPVGPHTISVRQNGVEVWQQKVNAEPASDYEFNPSFTDAKKRERAQRASRPPIARDPDGAAAPAATTDADAPPKSPPTSATPNPAPEPASEPPPATAVPPDAAPTPARVETRTPARGARPPITTLSP